MNSPLASSSSARSSAAAGVGPPDGGASDADAVIASLLGHLDARAVAWCLLPRWASRGAGTDVLVAEEQIDLLRRALQQGGFVELRPVPPPPRHVFVQFDLRSASWLVVNVVTTIAFGRDWLVPTRVAHECLSRRRRSGCVFRLSEDDEFWTILVQFLGNELPIDPDNTERLLGLAGSRPGAAPLSRGFEAVAPPGWSALRVLDAISSRDWRALQELERAWATKWARRGALSSARCAVDWSLRPLQVLLHARRSRGITVAVMGMDGAGKSTLIRNLQEASPLPIRSVYMGLWRQTGLLHRTPLLRPVRIAARPLAAWRRYLVGRIQRALGRIVLFDRYTYDPYEPPTPPLARLKKAYLQLLARACPAPDLILLLDVPVDVALARKDEEDRSTLQTKRDLFLRLRDDLPQLRVIDASQPPDVVRAESFRQIWTVYSQYNS